MTPSLEIVSEGSFDEIEEETHEAYHVVVSSPLDDLCIDIWISVMII